MKNLIKAMSRQEAKKIAKSKGRTLAKARGFSIKRKGKKRTAYKRYFLKHI